jgi:hypothetical protein
MNRKHDLLILAIFVFASAGALNIIGQTPGRDSERASETVIEGTQIGIRVVAVRDNPASNNEYFKPEEGNKFVSVQIVIENRGDEPWDVQPEYFVLKDGDGNVYEPLGSLSSAPMVTTPILRAGILDGKDLVRGWISFSVGKEMAVKAMRIRYEQRGSIFEEAAVSGWIQLATAAR